MLAAKTANKLSRLRSLLPNPFIGIPSNSEALVSSTWLSTGVDLPQKPTFGAFIGRGNEMATGNIKSRGDEDSRETFGWGRKIVSLQRRHFSNQALGVVGTCNKGCTSE
ncbi:RNA-directed RNA polymerase, partial [Actinidia chinensis var. chinensis]